MAAEGRGPLMHARIGMLQALNVNDEIRPGTLKAMIRQFWLTQQPFQEITERNSDQQATAPAGEAEAVFGGAYVPWGDGTDR